MHPENKEILKTLSISPLFNVMAFSACWAFQIFFAKLGFNAGALVLPFQIMLVISALIATSTLLLRSSGRKLLELFEEQPRIFWTLFLANMIQAGLGNILNIIGISMTAAINAGFLVKMSMVTTTLFAWLVLGERLSPLKGVVVGFMLLGAYLLTTRGQSLLPHIGDLYILSACVCWSLATVIVRKTIKTRSINADVITLQKAFASLFFFVVVIGIVAVYPTELGNLPDTLRLSPFTLNAFPYALVSGITLSLAWIFLFRTLQVATASYMTLMSMATPIIVSVLAMLFLGESLVWIQIAGAGLIILSAGTIYVSDIAYS